MLNLPRTHPRIELGQLIIQARTHERLEWISIRTPYCILYINAHAPDSPHHSLDTPLFYLYSFIFIFKYDLMPVMPTNPSVWTGMQR